jgi:hypothetical protein
LTSYDTWELFVLFIHRQFLSKQVFFNERFQQSFSYLVIYIHLQPENIYLCNNEYNRISAAPDITIHIIEYFSLLLCGVIQKSPWRVPGALKTHFEEHPGRVAVLCCLLSQSACKDLVKAFVDGSRFTGRNVIQIAVEMFKFRSQIEFIG